MVRYTGGVNEIMTFYPTMEEFKDFIGVIKAMEAVGAQNFGIAKVVPPPEWKPRREPFAEDLENIGDFIIPAPIEQNMMAVSPGNSKAYQVVNLQKKKMTVRDYRAMAVHEQVGLDYNDMESVERAYWRSLSFKPSIYGADVSGSLTDEDLNVWNCAKLPSILDCLAEEYGSRIEGVNTPYLYFGMWKTTFAIHTEDMDLYSINYNHFGAPKFWYALSPANARKFERAASQFFPCESKECPAYLRHKSVLFSQNWFKFYSIPYYKAVQKQNEFIITFPMGYHWGFNTGLNIAESTNFATERWIEYGKRCSRCTCEPDRVNISMEAFVRRYQSDRYSDWLCGRDFGRHPDAPPSERATCAPPPSLEDLECTPNQLPVCIERIEELRTLRKNGLDPMGKKIPGLSKKAGTAKTSKRQSTAVLALETSKKLKVTEDKVEKPDATQEDPVVKQEPAGGPDSFPHFGAEVAPKVEPVVTDEAPVEAEEAKHVFIGPGDGLPMEQKAVDGTKDDAAALSPKPTDEPEVKSDEGGSADVAHDAEIERAARERRVSAASSESRRQSRSRKDMFPDSDEEQDPDWSPGTDSASQIVQKKPTTPTKVQKPKIGSQSTARPVPAPKVSQKQPPAVKPKRPENTPLRKQTLMARVAANRKSEFKDPLSLLDHPASLRKK